MKYQKQILIIGLAFVCQWSQAQNTTTWTNGHTYQVVFADNPTWFQAQDAAATMTLDGATGYLATFVTRAEQEFVISHLGGGSYLNQLWLGGYQDTLDPNYSEPYGGWKWITGEPWLGVASDDPVLPRADAGFNNLYFDLGPEGYTITWWQTGGVNDYAATPSAAYGYPARGFIVEFNVAAKVTAILRAKALGDGNLEIVAAINPPVIPHDCVLQSTTDYTSWTAVSTNSFPSSGMVTNIVQTTNSMSFYRVELK